MTSIPDSPWPYLIEKLRNARNISFSSFSIIKVWRVMKLYFHSHDDEQMLGLRILVEIKKYLLITSAKMTWTRRFNCIRLHCKWSCCSNACVTFLVFRPYRSENWTNSFKNFSDCTLNYCQQTLKTAISFVIPSSSYVQACIPRFFLAHPVLT